MSNKKQEERYTVGRALSNQSYSPNRPDAQQGKRPPEQPSPDKPKESAKKRRRFGWKRLLLIFFIIILTPLLVIGIWDYRNLSSASQKMFGTGNLLAAFPPASLDGANRGRVNVMIVGYSADDPGHAGADLTDSIMVLSMDTEDKTGYMLSVPRDLYVSIPGSGRAKINEAYQRGENLEFKEAGYPLGGIGLLEKTIEESFAIPIDYYVLVNYAAVRDITNALGGITVNIQSEDPRGIYDPNFKPEEGGPLKLQNGPQEIDGQTALRLTRARGSTFGSYGLALSDFDRTKNQRQVMLAIKSELGWQELLDPRQNSEVLDAIASNLETNLKIDEVMPLYRLFNGIPEPQMQSVSLRDINGQNLLASYRTPLGQSALIPAAGIGNFEQIQAALDSLDK